MLKELGLTYEICQSYELLAEVKRYIGEYREAEDLYIAARNDYEEQCTYD